MTRRLDFLGDPMPEGYEAWSCNVCTAACNFEAMQMCAKRTSPSSDCGFDRDQPESNGGCFGFIQKGVPMSRLIERQIDHAKTLYPVAIPGYVYPRRVGPPEPAKAYLSIEQLRELKANVEAALAKHWTEPTKDPAAR